MLSNHLISKSVAARTGLRTQIRHRKKINEHKLILGSYPEYGSQRNRADAETEVPQSAR